MASNHSLSEPGTPGLVSIIMPCYNAAPYLQASVASALQQWYQHLELIVVDDGSTDESRRLLTQIEDLRVRVLHQQKQGVCAARNRGLRAARGEYVAFLDADDTWHPECLAKLQAALTADREAVLAYCGWQNLGLPGRRGEPFVPPDYERPNKLALLLEECRWPIHAALTRRAAIERAGIFDARFPTSEDFFFWLRIASRQPIRLVPEVLAIYHHHDGPRATNDPARMARNHWLVQREFLRQNPGVVAELGPGRIGELTDGLLLKKGYACYWRRDLASAQRIFRMVMLAGHGGLVDWLRMLPSLLPLPLFAAIVAGIDRRQRKVPS
jgi:glycosyltransferase involved in cell wall biosynthesis